MIEYIYTLYRDCDQKISTDTRNILPGSLFFALKGENFNGNKFAAEAIEKGAVFAIIDEPEFVGEKTILVTDVLSTLQELATYYRLQSNFKVFALTGSNGKTTTKELIRTVLSTKFKCHSTQGNLNNHIGVPLTILSAPVDSEILIVEMGANHQGEIKHLASIALPDYGMITNIGKAHLEGFGGFEGVMLAKSELYNHLKQNNKAVFINATDELLVKLLGVYQPSYYYGTPETNCYAGDLVFDKAVSVQLFINDNNFSIATQLFGKYNVFNILAAVRIGLFFQIDVVSIIKAIESYTPANNRSQVLKTKSNTLILDSYNANPSSMAAALSSFFDIKSPRKAVILGAMKELGDYSFSEHKLLVEQVIQANHIKAYFVGQEFLPFQNLGINIFDNTSALSEFLAEEKLFDYLIFIKGSRSNKLESLIELL